MSVDPDLLTISQIAARLPGSRGASRVHPATITRWILTGCPDRTGTRVKLAATRAGTRWLVRVTDLDAFFAALAADSASVPAPAPRACSPRSFGPRACVREGRRGASGDGRVTRLPVRHHSNAIGRGAALLTPRTDRRTQWNIL